MIGGKNEENGETAMAQATTSALEETTTTSMEGTTTTPVPETTLLQSILIPEVGKCQQESITYLITCVGCAEVGVTTQYYGESGRTGYQRALEHLKAHWGKNKNSPLWKHSLGHHAGVRQRYSFKVLKSFKSALARQISEAVLIQIAGPDMLLNSRGEWNVCSIPRLILEDKEPEEEWSSERSKRKNSSKEPKTSSSGSGGDGSGCIDNESKSKKSKVTVPRKAITPAKKRKAELDIIVEEIPTFSAGLTCKQIVSVPVVRIGEVLEVVIEKEKGKLLLGTTEVVADGCMPKVKRRYVKKNLEYWNKRRLASLDRKGKVVV